MEQIKTIDQYIASEMGGKITKKANSPIASVAVLAIGVALLVMMRTTHASDSLQALMLTVGLLATAVGLVLVALSISKTLWHYVYQPTGSKMKDRKVYLGLADYGTCVDAIEAHNINALGAVVPVTSSNSALRVLYSRDGAAALLQAGRYDTGHFEAETPVVALVGTEVAAVRSLCK